jgi:hypothetical protein
MKVFASLLFASALAQTQETATGFEERKKKKNNYAPTTKATTTTTRGWS